MKATYTILKESLYDNEFNRLALLANVAGMAICYLIWTQLIQQKQIEFFTPYGIYPVQLVIVIWMLHLAISVYSYKVDKYISNLLIAAPILYSILIFILEIYYWTSI